MDKQMTMSLISDELRQAATPKKELLERMDRIIPWSRWTELVQPYYYKGERGNKPYPLERMLRIYVIQNLYNLADMAAKNEIIDSRAFSDFCGVDSSNQVPDGDTIGRFRNILEANDYRICRRPSTLKKLSRSGQYKARKAEYRKSSVRCKV
ncbi:MAG: transposase [Clostridia bacterium]|nr:transposase [Clostridia bacterium]